MRAGVALAAIAVVELISWDASGQQAIWSDCVRSDQCLEIFPAHRPIRREKTGNPDLDAAMAVCDRVRVPSQTIPDLGAWKDGYAGCRAVMGRYEATEAARREIERFQQDRKDRELVERVAREAK